MSLIVNERDRLLQAASQRIADTLMTPGVTIPQEQVAGLSGIVVDTKLVVLSASSQIFRIPKDVGGVAGTVDPSVISLTPTIKGLPLVPVFSASSGNASLVLANGGALLNYSDMLTDTVTIQCSVSDAFTAYSDQVTIAKMQNRADVLLLCRTVECSIEPISYSRPKTVKPSAKHASKHLVQWGQNKCSTRTFFWRSTNCKCTPSHAGHVSRMSPQVLMSSVR